VIAVIRLLKPVFVMMVLFAGGCGSTQVQAPPETGPLTVETWKVLPASEKYDESSFQRLRESDPKLKPDRAWTKFMKDVVIPERKIDIPGLPGQPAK
jgi:hypothetical protein